VANGSAGRFGDPRNRDPQKALEDVLGGFTTAEAARRDYGVELVEVDGKLRVDADLTAQLRADMARV
jgi:N-methylhydantoinase B